jgi:3-phosphoshikimate 1-carboxyvinyltransferase
MSQLIVKSSKVQGTVTVPSSKSHSHRAIIFGAMARGKTTIQHLLRSPDTEGMLQAWKTLGVEIVDEGDTLHIKGLNGQIDGAENVIDVGNSGIALRFLTALAALSPKPIVITGDHSIRHQRPMAPLLEALKQLNVQAISTKGDGYAPLIVQGPFKEGKVVVNGRDSQPVSALLIASIFSKGVTEIVVEEPGEIPWIELTLDWFNRLGVHYEHDNYSHYIVTGNGEIDGFNYVVPGDWSSAAFPAAASLVTKGTVTLHNIDRNDLQGDKKLFDLLEKMGAEITYNSSERSVQVAYQGPLKEIHADINDCIDCITILATVACFAEGTTTITNASVAKEKECDRIGCIAEELRKMGAQIQTTEDGLIIKGSPLHGAVVDSHDDHRMAMSLAVAAMGASGESTINGVDCINKTYPTFVEDMGSLGVVIQ